jgi:oxygen-independent coproporphyrinogen-3 oxidase
VYVHIPFCAFHCGYCDFAVAVGKDDRRDDYRRALIAEAKRLPTPQPVDTMFWGGGTPTLLSATQLEAYLRAMLEAFPLRAGHEFSVESNPGTLDADKVRVLAEHGVTRVSLGSQSFHAPLLQVLERDHVPADVPRAMAAVRRHLENVSLDLIFGVPGQTLEQWRDDLRAAIALEPTHVSTYGLTYEKGTRLWKQRRAGKVSAVPEETELAMYELAMDLLEAAGYEHYEISNFARPGFRCRHNAVYWANHAYFGLGMGAAKYLRGVRALNHRDLDAYLRLALAGEPTEFQSETLPPRERALETISIQLRRREGVERRSFATETGLSLDGLAAPILARLVELGLLEDTGTHVSLTRRGRCVADAVISEFWR